MDGNGAVTPKKRGISGSTLKMIAIVTMLIDHIGAVILYGMIRQRGWQVTPDESLVVAYQLMRDIGRISFPIFCFLLVEGFLHTRNAAKYALRLLLFALLSEVPFDLAFSGKAFDFSYQNVFFTLLISLLVLMSFQQIKNMQGSNNLKLFLLLLALGAGVILAEFLKTDYAGWGVLGVMVIYLFRGNRRNQMIAGAIAFIWEIPAPLAFLPIAFYNGERGFKMKYFFYAFYPVHLLLIYLVAHFYGLI